MAKRALFMAGRWRARPRAYGQLRPEVADSRSPVPTPVPALAPTPVPTTVPVPAPARARAPAQKRFSSLWSTGPPCSSRPLT